VWEEAGFGTTPSVRKSSFLVLLCYTNALLTHAHSEQDLRFVSAFRVIEQGIVDQAFPGASVAVLRGDDLIALRAFGWFTYDHDSPAVNVGTVFDLASVSKAVATTTAAAILYERGQLDIDTCVDELAFEFQTKDVRRADVTLEHLLTHTSGLPAYVRLYETCRSREELLAAAYTTRLVADPGTRTEYSDIGFIILGDILERLAGEPLDRFCQREIFDRLDLRHTRFLPPLDWRTSIPPTRDDRAFRHSIVQGQVNDENAWVMGGVAGHAGVFSTAIEVAQLARCWMLGGVPILKPATVTEFTRKRNGTARALGWDRPTPPSSSGQYFSPLSYGHLGYTGTSLWVDPSRELAVVLLTNRTWPDASNQAIKQIRPRFHDAVIEAIGFR
jgi:CubicO group peptidase (beta-lactamase class C family)